MTLFNFLDLDIDQKAAYVCRGKFLASRIEGQQHILLYRAGDFFAEIFYDTTVHQIVYVKGFNARSHLIAYPDHRIL